MPERKYDSTVARIAGNILSGARLRFGQDTLELSDEAVETLAHDVVRLARAIVVETTRTEPER